MDDQEILGRIGALVEEEQRLRESNGEAGLPEAERRRLASLEVALDQCWDLLRQRRARREFGLDPESAEARPADVVENYRQ
jgi:hypothetical protein